MKKIEKRLIDWADRFFTEEQKKLMNEKGCFIAIEDLDTDNMCYRISDYINEHNINTREFFIVTVINKSNENEKYKKYFKNNGDTLYLSLYNMAIYDYENYKGLDYWGIFVMASNIIYYINEGFKSGKIKKGDILKLIIKNKD